MSTLKKNTAAVEAKPTKKAAKSDQPTKKSPRKTTAKAEPTKTAAVEPEPTTKAVDPKPKATPKPTKVAKLVTFLRDRLMSPSVGGPFLARERRSGETVFVEVIGDKYKHTNTTDPIFVKLANSAFLRELGDTVSPKAVSAAIDVLSYEMPTVEDERKPVARAASHAQAAAFGDGVTDDQTDLRNAERLVEWYGEELRFCSSWGKWLAQDGSRWSLDDVGRAHALAKQTARRMLKEALEHQQRASERLAEAVSSGEDSAISAAKKDFAKAAAEVAHAIASPSRRRRSTPRGSAMARRSLIVAT